MSRTLRFVVAAIAVAGGLTLAAPNAEAAGMGTRAPDFWSFAVDWITDLWEEEIVNSREAEGWLIDPNGGTSSSESTETEEGWLIDPNG